MIKLLKNQDIQISQFATTKQKTVDNYFRDILLLNDENYEFPIILNIETCNYNFNASDVSGSLATVSSTCKVKTISNSDFLATSPNSSTELPTVRFGKKYTSDIPFYSVNEIYYDSEINPINADGTYQGQVYNTIKKMYYNDYDNCYNKFGIDGFYNPNIELNLSNNFTVYSFHITQSGDRIRQRSININNQSGDVIAYIKDDGYNNLYLSGSYYIDSFIKSTNDMDNVKLYNDHGISKYIYESQTS